MTESEAKAMIEAYMECYRRKNDVVYEKQCHEDCDNCEQCYAQGIVREHNKALNIAIKALEKQVQKKVVVNKNIYLCPNCGANAETDCGDDMLDYRLNYCDNCGQKLDWSEL